MPSIINLMGKNSLTWFHKFLISYILLLLIPLIILGVVFVAHVDKIYIEKKNSENENKVDYLFVNLENEAKKLNDVAAQLKLLNMIPENYDFTERPLYANNIKLILSSYQILSPFYDALMYCNFNQDIFYMNSSTITESIFYENFELLDETESTLKEILPGINKPTSLKVDSTFNDTPIILHAVPVNISPDGKIGALLFMFSTENLTTYFENKLGENIAYSISSDFGHEFFSKPLVHDVEYHEFDYNMKYLDWVIRIYVPEEDSLFAGKISYFAPFLFAIALILLISSAAIMYFMRHNYGPIGNLHKKVQELGTVEDGETRDEFKAIAGTITKLNSRNLDLKNEVLSLQEDKMNIELQKLVTGGFYDSYESFNAANSRYLKLNDKYFFFTIWYFKDICSEIEEFASKLQKDLNATGLSENYYVYTPFPRRLYLISNLDDESSFTPLKKCIARLRADFEVEYGNVITVGCSNVGIGINSIPSLMLEARSALDYRFIKGRGNLISFEEVHQEGPEYPKAQLNNIKKALLAHNTDAINAGLDDFVDYLAHNNLSLFETQGTCFEIMQTYLQANPEEKDNGILRKEILELSTLGTAKELVDKIRECCMKQESDTENCSVNEVEMIEQAKKYIRENCLDCNFSAQAVADNIGMNVSKLSTLYSKVTGEYLVDYVSYIRMDAATRLLEETDLPIKEISGKVGYYNTSSFIRRFRQLKGMSPGDYRKLFSE